MLTQALVSDQGFQHIIRVLNTNVDGRQKVMFAITAIKDVTPVPHNGPRPPKARRI